MTDTTTEYSFAEDIAKLREEIAELHAEVRRNDALRAREIRTRRLVVEDEHGVAEVGRSGGSFGLTITGRADLEHLTAALTIGTEEGADMVVSGPGGFASLSAPLASDRAPEVNVSMDKPDGARAVVLTARYMGDYEDGSPGLWCGEIELSDPSHGPGRPYIDGDVLDVLAAGQRWPGWLMWPRNDAAGNLVDETVGGAR